MKSITPMLTTSLVVSVWLLSTHFGHSYYSPSTGRWLIRDPVNEPGFRLIQAGLQRLQPRISRDDDNPYVFVRDQPISKIDRLGLQEGCKKCGVKSVSLQIVGISFRGDTNYRFHLVGKASFITSSENPKYDSTCCAIRQWLKATVTYNGKLQPTSAGGSPLDGNWHLDTTPWVDDDPKHTRPNMSPVSSTADGNEYIDVTVYDGPGINGINNGDTIDDSSAFQWKVYDECNDWKVVKSSNVPFFHVYGTWPDIQYQYSR